MTKLFIFLTIVSLSFSQNEQEVRISFPITTGESFYTNYDGLISLAYSRTVLSEEAYDIIASFSFSLAELNLSKLVNLSDQGFTKSFQYKPSIGLAKAFSLSNDFQFKASYSLAYNLM